MTLQEQRREYVEAARLLEYNGQFVADLQPAVSQMNPNQQQQVSSILDRMNTTLTALDRQLPTSIPSALYTPTPSGVLSPNQPTPTPTPSTVDARLRAIDQHTSEIRQGMMLHSTQARTANITQTLALIDDLVGETTQLYSAAQPVVSQMTQAQQQKLYDDLHNMRASASRMVSSAGVVGVTPTAGTGTPSAISPTPTPGP